MILDDQLIETLIFKKHPLILRFTQDSPVYPDVWMDYYQNRYSTENHRCDLILTPNRKSSARELFQYLANKFEGDPQLLEGWQIASNNDTVVAKLTLYELVTIILPLTQWWRKYVIPGSESNPNVLWLAHLVGAIRYAATNPGTDENRSLEAWYEIFEGVFWKYYGDYREFANLPLMVWSVNRNRPATISIEKSVPATKADAGRRLFDIDGSEITWAVMDSGIDASHPGFRKKDSSGKLFDNPFGDKTDKFSNHTRVVATYDFSNFREILTKAFSLSGQRDMLINQVIKSTSTKDDQSMQETDIDDHLQDIRNSLKNGRQLDWTVMAPLLRIPHNTQEYKAPLHPHGTHVAGILGANLIGEDGVASLIGMCPGIELYDIRVMDDKGVSDEFNILAAISFVRWLNNQKDAITIHGVNMSFSMTHDVASYACGQTPVCVSCERLVSEGTVVVAAAGNLGQTYFQARDGSLSQGFRMVNITDPGNAEKVITVGATHRNLPHVYGVSYFSSKGPTGDGRIKPDIVAPGEKIVSLTLDEGEVRMDGTSMAAPHVSGAAALLMAKHQELIGRPEKVKAVLCKTATDLGRERYFQGCGMVDVLRAIQSV